MNAKENGELPAGVYVGPNEICAGLTKRELFAAMAMQGFATNPTSDDWSYEDHVRVSARLADLLLLVLAESQP